MTDEALSGGATAPAESTGAPIDTNPASHSEPLGSQVPPQTETPVEDKAKEAAKPETTKKEPATSVRDAIAKASEQVKAKREADAKAKADAEAAKAKPEDGKPAEKAEQKPVTQQTRAPDGKFQGQQATQEAAQAQEGQQPTQQPSAQQSAFRDAPSRFDDSAKAEWANAPESVKGAVHRTIREMEQGIEKYRESADKYEQLREYDQMASQHGTTVKQALDNYVRAEQMLAQNPIQGLQNICERMGISLRDVAARVLNQSPDEVQSQHDATVRELKQQIGQLQQHIQQIGGTLQQQHQQGVTSQIQEFVSAKNPDGSLKYPRVQELEEDMAFFLQNKRANTLSEAYELADRLNPAPANAAHTGTPAPAPAQTRPPANPAGQKSVSGAPTTGSDPAERKKAPAKTTREALKSAFARAG